MDSHHNFQPQQIVCLEYKDNRLYGEVIQVIESRQVCWVRPLLLMESTAATDSATELPMSDLRASADLLWPLTWFRSALDTEVIPLLVQLWASAPQPDRNPVGQKQLHQFIHQVWQGQKEGSDN